MLEEFYTKYAHGFFFLDVVFPCSFIDKHFRVAVEPFHYRRIIFFVRPFENLIGRRFPQFSPVTCGNAVLIHNDNVTYCRNCFCFQRGFYVPRDTFYIQFYFYHVILLFRGRYCFCFCFFLAVVIIER